MEEKLRTVALGLLIGLFTLVFGIVWAFYLVLGHESLHERFEKDLESIKSNFILEENTHSSQSHSHGEEKMEHVKAPHEEPLIETAHERLTRGHIHSMGLGLLTIAISLMLAFLDMPSKIKTIGSVLTSIGGLVYPLCWIIMGYRTPLMGDQGAEDSVMLIAGPSIILVMSGILIAVYYTLKMSVKKF